VRTFAIQIKKGLHIQLQALLKFWRVGDAVGYWLPGAHRLFRYCLFDWAKFQQIRQNFV
jgi:hypothetical protein